MAEHDVEWGKLEIGYGDDGLLNDGLRSNSWTEHYLSLGLSYLHQLFDTSTFDERCQLLKPRRERSLYTLLHGLGNVRLLQEQQVCKDDQMGLNVDRFSPDSTMGKERGPEEAWRWGTIANGLLRVSGPERTLRKRGYVMWDFARLAAWGLLDQDWHSIPCEEPVHIVQLSRRMADNLNSWKARSAIWERGGRGWWSFGDESRVVWPPGSQAT